MIDNGDRSAFGYANAAGVEAGLSKREYIATLVMPALIGRASPRESAREIAKVAVAIADALLEELENIKPEID